MSSHQHTDSGDVGESGGCWPAPAGAQPCGVWVGGGHHRAANQHSPCLAPTLPNHPPPAANRPLPAINHPPWQHLLCLQLNDLRNFIPAGHTGIPVAHFAVHHRGACWDAILPANITRGSHVGSVVFLNNVATRAARGTQRVLRVNEGNKRDKEWGENI